MKDFLDIFFRWTIICVLFMYTVLHILNFIGCLMKKPNDKPQKRSNSYPPIIPPVD